MNLDSNGEVLIRGQTLPEVQQSEGNFLLLQFSELRLRSTLSVLRNFPHFHLTFITFDKDFSSTAVLGFQMPPSIIKT